MFPRSILRSRSFIFSSTRCIMRSKLSIALAPESVVTALGSITPEVPEAAAAAAFSARSFFLMDFFFFT